MSFRFYWTYEPALRRFYRWYIPIWRRNVGALVLYRGERIVGQARS